VKKPPQCCRTGVRMGDDELTPEQKKSIAANFVKMSPPAQQLKVVEDVKMLVGADILTPDQEEDMLRALNKEQFSAVSLSNGTKVLITPHGEVPGGFMDPGSKKLMKVNHSKLECTAEEELPAAVLNELQSVASKRDAIDAAMRKHATEFLPSSVVTTYGSAANGEKITCCVAALASDLPNFSAGRWWAEWTLTTGGGSMGQLTGLIKCNVHYFEDGNVQLDDAGKYQVELNLGGDVGAAFVKQVANFEQEWVAKQEEIYATLSEQVLQSLRRRLPITKMKFDWDKHAVAKLAMDLQTQAMGR